MRNKPHPRTRPWSCRDQPWSMRMATDAASIPWLWHNLSDANYRLKGTQYGVLFLCIASQLLYHIAGGGSYRPSRAGSPSRPARWAALQQCLQLDDPPSQRQRSTAWKWRILYTDGLSAQWIRRIQLHRWNYLHRWSRVWIWCIVSSKNVIIICGGVGTQD